MDAKKLSKKAAGKKSLATIGPPNDLSKRARNFIEQNRTSQEVVLDLGMCGLTAVPNEILEFHWLEELRLANSSVDFDTGKFLTGKGKPNKLASIPNLKSLGELKRLSIGPLEEQLDLKNIAGLKKLDTLEADSCHIGDLGPLARLKNLKRLFLSHNQIADLMILSKLGGLTHLFLADNHLSDIDPLGKLDKLLALDLSAN